jgi:hypothetical protein
MASKIRLAFAVINPIFAKIKLLMEAIKGKSM